MTNQGWIKQRWTTRVGSQFLGFLCWLAFVVFWIGSPDLLAEKPPIQESSQEERPHAASLPEKATPVKKMPPSPPKDAEGTPASRSLNQSEGHINSKYRMGESPLEADPD